MLINFIENFHPQHTSVFSHTVLGGLNYVYLARKAVDYSCELPSILFIPNYHYLSLLDKFIFRAN